MHDQQNIKILCPFCKDAEDSSLLGCYAMSIGQIVTDVSAHHIVVIFRVKHSPLWRNNIPKDWNCHRLTSFISRTLLEFFHTDINI